MFTQNTYNKPLQISTRTDYITHIHQAYTLEEQN